ncbi:MAG: polymer-forming cytoskeletal protein [Spirochaetaceae bacterium]|nr:MAG: polymer-forming cytoskeletal protein [Spirochaetaceae bacterium]
MSDLQIPGGPYINSIIGEGTRFNGEFDLNGLLRIDGDFCGTVRTEGKVLVGKNGRAECTVYAGTVVVGGILRGNIFANEKVVILSTGIVLGNIHSPRFIVEEGVIFNGTAKIVQPETKAGGPKTTVEKIEPESYAPLVNNSSADKRPVSVSAANDSQSATG